MEMPMFSYNLGPGWIGDMSGCGYNLCFAVEPPRSFCFGKNNIFLNSGHAHVRNKVDFRQALDFWVITQIKIGLKAQPGLNDVQLICIFQFM